MYVKTLSIALILALIVVVLGAYTRLGDAGLGCPDWPGCYGQLIVPDVLDGTTIEGYERPVETAKGWKEMVHRYAASTLGLLIVVLFFLAAFRKSPRPQSAGLPSFLVGLVIFQGLLGMWTVTELVHPGIVSMHLIGGFSTTCLLLWLLLNQQPPSRHHQHILKRHKLILITAFALLCLQIFLGGWTSTNYAALSCGDYFPTCLGEWWPTGMNFANAFFWGPLGVDYEFGVLDHDSRSAIQVLHRIGALVVTTAIVILIVSLKNYPRLKTSLMLVMVMLALQVALGILNVLLSLPILVAVMHNAVALGLLLSLVALMHKVFRKAIT
ncbi:MAG: COX15/CtaA family protein [Gammaproteobacteria bacterium]|nr:COX15/CtaA family protein [Gammaproteobacteria bacterium]